MSDLSDQSTRPGCPGLVRDLDLGLDIALDLDLERLSKNDYGQTIRKDSCPECVLIA